MIHRGKFASSTIAAVAASLLVAGCATRGALQKAMAEQRTALSTEHTERVATDSATQQDVTTLRNDQQSLRTELQALRSDLQSLRTEFGAKIAMVDSGMRFAFPVNFAFDESIVRDQDHLALSRFAQVVGKYYQGSLITVEGFADPAGTTQYNLALSRRRADAVKSYIVSQGIPDQLVKTVGYGKTRLVVPGASRDQAGAESNRRVVFVVESKGQVPVPVALLDSRDNR
ncbi:MAG TPA: OmpA family protein [Gemmatimonadaceae bacterium]|nr:OmpA family protein [Gemmatimonadaceae bacterium]